MKDIEHKIEEIDHSADRMQLVPVPMSLFYSVPCLRCHGRHPVVETKTLAGAVARISANCDGQERGA